MKALLKNTKFLICFLVLVATVCITIGTITLTSSSYVTSVNQYAAVATTTPAKLNGEVKLSFCNGSNNKQDDGVYYITSSYSSSYYMAVENASNMTDYFDNPLSSMDESTALEYFDIFGSVKSKNSYGSLTGGSFDYTMPLATEWNVGSAKNGQTTFNITPFSTDISVTIYFSMGATLKADGEYYARTNWSAFVFNNNEIAYDPDGSNTSDGLVKCDNNAYGAYSFTASTSSEDHKNSHALYMYTTTVDAEEAINIATATQSQAMIFLIVLTPVTGVAVKDGGSATSSYISTSGTTTVTLTASYNTLPSSLSSLTGTWTSSNTSVATISSTSGTTITVTAVGSGVAQITYTIGGATAVYTVYVVGASISGSNTVYIGKTADYTADIYLAENSGLSVSNYEWSLSDLSSTNCVTLSSSSNTATLTGAAEGSATLKLTVTLSDTSTYTAELAITVTEVVPTDAEINITTLVDEGELSEATYKANTTLYSGSDGTSVIVLATSDKTVAVDDNTKSIDGFSFSYRLKLSGDSKLSNDGADNYRAIKIETVSEATITVYAMSGSKESTRKLVLYNSSYTALDATQCDDGNNITKYTYTVSSDGIYYLGAPDGAMNIYYIKIDYPETGVAVSDGNGTSSTISVGETLTLTATLTNISLSDYDLAWSSSSTCATVASSGDYTATVKGVAAGTATITVTAKDSDGNEYTETFEITVTDTLTVTAPDDGSTDDGVYSITTTTGTATLTATTSNSTLYWSSSDDSVATVSASTTTGTDGTSSGTYTHTVTVTGVSAGTTTITVTTAGGTEVTYTIHVDGYIVAGENGATSVTVGSSINLYLYSVTNGEQTAVGDVSWSATDKDGTTSSYATIAEGTSGAGVLTGSSVGTVTVTATYNTNTYTTDIEVKAASTVVLFESGGTSATNNGFTISNDNEVNYASSGTTFTYNGTEYTTNSALKIETGIKITFTTTTDMILTLGLSASGKKISVDDATNTSDSDGIVTFKIKAGEHTISKGDSMNLYYAILEVATGN